MKKRVAIIGCGNIAGALEIDAGKPKPCKGIHTHLGAYRTRKDAEVVGCCDVNLRRAKKFATQFDIPYWTNSIRCLLRRKIDILSICVPYKFNFQVMREVFNQRNIPSRILLEKPIAGSLGDAQKIIAMAKKKNVKLYVNNRRLDPSVEVFKKTIHKKFNNEVVSVLTYCSSGAHAIGIHMADMLRYVFGEVVWVFAAQEKDRIKKIPYSTNFNANDPRFSGVISFKSGLKASWFNFARTDFICFDIEAICKTGKVRLSYHAPQKVMYQKNLRSKRAERSYLLGKERFPPVRASSLFKRGIDKVFDGGYAHSPLKGEEGLKSYAVIDALRKSAAKKSVQYV